MKNPLVRNKRRFFALETRVIFLEAALETFFNNPVYLDSDDVGFNGQRIRKAIFNELCSFISFEAIVETGTHTGNTSGYMAKKTALPIYSCESNRVLSALAKTRLSGIENVNCYAMDSREFLDSLANSDISHKRIFIYLDAHCHDDLPLKQEIEIICRIWEEFVIMIDDFQVPGDAGYGFDTYAGNQSLSIKKYLSVISQNELVPFFPAKSSSEETGAKRGSLILTRRGDLAEKISRSNLLKKYYS